MRRIDTATKKEIQDKNGKSFKGFVEGNPEAGVEPTHLSDSWCNNLQEEICNVIEGVGHKINEEMAPSGNNEEVRVEKYDQMFQAIKLLVDAVTPIGSVKAMSVKMTENIAKWVPIDENDDEAASIIGTEGTAYLSKEMAKNCEQVDGNKAGWYKLISINKENGDPSGVSGWALADGTFPLPLKPFGEDDETRPETEEEKNKRENILSDTEYGKIYIDKNDLDLYGNPRTKNDKGWIIRGFSNAYGTLQEAEPSFYPIPNDEYNLKEEDLLPPEDDTPIDTRTWTENNTKKPKLIPNLNDKTFLMGSNEENLPLTVEGKNAFMMKNYHVPAHTHTLTPHTHYIPVTGASSTGRGSKVKDNATSPDSNQHGTILSHISKATYNGQTGGYYINSFDHDLEDENGDPVNKPLFGNVPIDLRPKRLAVYYYIRVI